MSERALDVMYALRIEDGRRWGEAAHPFQIVDAEAILLNENPLPTYHFLTRGRGSSKSSDIAAVALAWLAVDAPALSNGHIIAASTEQASIIIDAAAGFVARTEEMEGVLTVESKRILAPNGAWVEVLAQSDSGSWGLRDAHLLIMDEFCQWPETRGAKRVKTAIFSAAAKVLNCKLVILSSAGEPSHWSREVFEKCCEDPMWRVVEVPGPSPWLTKEALASQEFQLRPSEYERLFLNIWSEDEDSAISEEQWLAAAQPYTSLGPRKGVRYIMLVDVGLVNDATVMTLMHREPYDPEEPRGPQRVVVDHIERWRGTKKKPVQLSAVEDWIVAKSIEYNRCQVHADPTQFVGSMQRLSQRGVRVKEFKFTSTSVGEVASALTSTFRNQQIHVPDIPVLKQEMLALKLRESAPGVTRLDHARNAHDDQAVTLGMGCQILIGHGLGIGSGFKEFMKRDTEKRAEDRGNERETRAAIRRAERQAGFRVRSFRAERERAKLNCQHRWSPDRSRCMFCDEVNVPAEVS